MDRATYNGKDILAVASIVFAGTRLLAVGVPFTVSDVGVSGYFVAATFGCALLYFLLRTAGLTVRPLFVRALMLLAIVVGVWASSFCKVSEPIVYGIAIPLRWIFISAYFVAAGGQKHNGAFLEEHAFCSIVFMSFLAICADLQGILAFAILALFCSLACAGRDFVKALVCETVAIAISAMLILRDGSSAAAVGNIIKEWIRLILSIFSNRAGFSSDCMGLFEIYGESGMLFAFLLACLLIFAISAHPLGLALSAFMVVLMCLSVIPAVFGYGQIAFNPFPDNAIALVALAIVLAHAGNVCEALQDSHMGESEAI